MRKIVFWIHLTAGACVGAVVLVMSFTGVMLTYEKQMIAWADARAAGIVLPAPGTARASIDTIVERVGLAAPETAIASVTRRADPRAPVTVSLAGGTTILVHPYTGHVIGEAPSGIRRVFRTATDWHRVLAAKGENRAAGKAITGACNLAFLFLILSGMYLWIPRRWTRQAVAAIILPRVKHATPRARDFNWHHAFGLWAAVPLIVVVASATVISYPWASALAYRVMGENPPARASARPAAASPGEASPAPTAEGLDPLWARAEAQAADWRAISMRPPASADAPVTFTIDTGSGGQPQHKGTLSLARSGETLAWEPFSTLSAGRQFRSILRFAHTGEVLGLTGQTIAGLASAAACVLVWTGVALALRRFRAWRRRRGAESVLPQAA